MFDSKEEAISSVGEKKIWNREDAWNRSGEIKAGDLFCFDDGKVTEITRVDNYPRVGFTSYKTILCKFTSNYARWSRQKLNGIFQPVYLINPVPLDLPPLDVVTDDRVDFAYVWLFEGLSMVEAVKATMLHAFKRDYMRRTGKIPRFDRGGGKELFARFGREILNGTWFDKLLQQDRLIRDRYMTLVGAMDVAGINEEYVAQKLKTAVENGSEREKINALNKIIDIIQANEGKRKRMIGVPYQEQITVGKEENDLTRALPPASNQKEAQSESRTEEGNKPKREILSPEETTEDFYRDLGISKDENGRAAGTETIYSTEQTLQVAEETINGDLTEEELLAKANSAQGEVSPEKPKV